MIPAFLITLREVIEASLIVATILGVLTNLHQDKKIKTVWSATACALAASFLLVFFGSTLGVNIQKIYTPATEGFLSILSAFFITWAVFTLHNRFARKKMHLLSRMKETIKQDGIFLFTFTSVFREGIEIALFLSTQYVTNVPLAVITGFAGGIAAGIFISLLFFYGTIHMPVFWAFRATSYLLILVAGISLARGLSEFHVQTITTIPAIAGLTYIFLMHRWVFVRSR